MKWFETWFESKYYHILYKERGKKEAKLLLNNLINYLKPNKSHLFLDLACGKGRHSIYLNSKGYNVLGADLSKKSILSANKYSNETLKFIKHDMRLPIQYRTFDYILNLFTSFGYFDTKEENQMVISAINKNLNKNGTLIIDFLNTKKVISNLVIKEEKIIEGIKFFISRKIKKNLIIKNINIHHKKNKCFFQEKIHAFTLYDFQKLVKKENLKIIDIFGDYQLNDFNATISDRLILIIKK